MQALQYDASHYSKVSEIFNICQGGLKDAASFGNLIAMTADSIAGMAQVNYPYPATMQGSLPAWPLNASCNALLAYKPEKTEKAETVSVFDYTNIYKVQAAANVSYNSSGTL